MTYEYPAEAVQEFAAAAQQSNAATRLANERITQALALIYDFGQVDGDHHKAWVIDQVARILADDYEAWVREYTMPDEDGEPQYEWDEGIAP